MISSQELRSSIYMAALQGKLTTSLRNENTDYYISTFVGKEEFEIPPMWKWCKFADVVTIATNLVNPDEHPDDFQIAPDYIEKGTGRLLPCHTVAQNKIRSKNHLFHSGQIIYSKIRPALRKAVIAPFDGLCSADMYPLDTDLNTEFLLLCLLSDYFTKLTLAKSAREKMPKINQKDLNELPLPIPPIEEQQRIVNRVNELLAKVNDFKKIEQQLLALKSAFPRDMQTAILQAAMQGKLTEQLETDSSADQVLLQTSKLRSATLSKYKIQSTRATANDSLIDLPFEIPDNWQVSSIDTLCCMIPTKQYQIQQKEIQSEGMYPVVSQSMNMIEGYYDDAAKLLKNSNVILIFGDHSKTLKYVDFDFIVGADGTKLIVPIFINPMFLYYALQYNLINLPDRGYARHFGLLRKTQIPVPPIEEQQRIVEYLDRLLPLCDELI